MLLMAKLFVVRRWEHEEALEAMQCRLDHQPEMMQAMSA
jgi:hypothetical protein